MLRYSGTIRLRNRHARETIVSLRQAKHFLKQDRGRKEEEQRAAGTAAQRGAYEQLFIVVRVPGFT